MKFFYLWCPYMWAQYIIRSFILTLYKQWIKISSNFKWKRWIFIIHAILIFLVVYLLFENHCSHFVKLFFKSSHLLILFMKLISSSFTLTLHWACAFTRDGVAPSPIPWTLPRCSGPSTCAITSSSILADVFLFSSVICWSFPM